MGREALSSTTYESKPRWLWLKCTHVEPRVFLQSFSHPFTPVRNAHAHSPPSHPSPTLTINPLSSHFTLPLQPAPTPNPISIITPTPIQYPSVHHARPYPQSQQMKCSTVSACLYAQYAKEYPGAYLHINVNERRSEIVPKPRHPPLFSLENFCLHLISSGYIWSTGNHLCKSVSSTHLYTAVLLHGQTLFMFGGTSYPWGETSNSDVIAFKLKDKTWSTLACRGHRPPGKYGQVSLESLFGLFTD